MKQTPTAWFCVATAGPTVDGREIKEQWLTEAAETYNAAEYTAMIWPSSVDRHQKWYNLGTVHSVKCETVNGKVKLYARFLPNKWMMSLNRDDQQKLFPSVEILENFASTGKHYLAGIAVTDLPASTGTDRLEFSGAPGVISFCSGEPLTEVAEKESFLTRLFSRLPQSPEQGARDPDNNQEDDNMNEQQFTQLMSVFNTAVEKMGTAVDEIKSFSAKQNTTVIENNQNGLEGDQPQVVTVEQFTALDGKVDQLLQKFTALSGETTEQPNGEPAQGVPEYLV
ncbi:phage capsid protein [Salmonella enterica subsp. enterica]|nr:phage capsid protein [Salmonella enterica subsp. enterica serovar Agbeni]ECL0916759.1 phage capsid protein [Salmonella enterica subsp. enterica serovar Agbeni]